ncbi:hypothetical protein KFL_000250240 [Klebsormidium nitens]|uniref:RING-type domain-containing protein n=1 Tax=Klebsormidium nitens TaxID=105231 RepID=A0A1Y1HRF6_KLENI|nr:hypothetical protein KFL_000250240 [Klebsormidium nitens]|eukprot:GAQ79147.1 hypothetical protein KFL_000250240 [Klebsormidium nitens]
MMTVGLFENEAGASEVAPYLTRPGLQVSPETARETTSKTAEKGESGLEFVSRAVFGSASTIAASEGASKGEIGVEQEGGARGGETEGLSDCYDPLAPYLRHVCKQLPSESTADWQSGSPEAKPSSIEPAQEKPDCCLESASISKLRHDLEAAKAQLEREQEQAQRSLDEKTRELREQIAAERAAIEKDKERLRERWEELEQKERNGGGVGECISCMDDWSETTVRHHFACGHALLCRKCSVKWLSGQAKPPYKCSVGCNLKKSKAVKPVYLG